MAYGVKNYQKEYRSIETTIPGEQSEYIDYVPAGVHAHRWVLCNDSTHVTLLVKVNSLDNEVISIKAGKFFGDDISVDHLLRDPTVASDTYGSDAALVALGLHIECDTVGSRDTGTK